MFRRYDLCALGRACAYEVRIVCIRYGLCLLGTACIYRVRILGIKYGWSL